MFGFPTSSRFIFRLKDKLHFKYIFLRIAVSTKYLNTLIYKQTNYFFLNHNLYGFKKKSVLRRNL